MPAWLRRYRGFPPGRVNFVGGRNSFWWSPEMGFVRERLAFAQSLRQFFDADGFGEVIVHASFHAGMKVLHGCIGGHGNNARPAPVRPALADTAGGLQAVHLWHL